MYTKVFHKYDQRNEIITLIISVTTWTFKIWRYLIQFPIIKMHGRVGKTITRLFWCMQVATSWEQSKFNRKNTQFVVLPYFLKYHDQDTYTWACSYFRREGMYQNICLEHNDFTTFWSTPRTRRQYGSCKWIL